MGWSTPRGLLIPISMASGNLLLLLSRNRSVTNPRTSLSSQFSNFATFSSSCKRPAFTFPEQSPPLPKKVPFKVSAHGRTWDDPYHWMCDTKDPEFVRYLHEENSYTEAFMADTIDLQSRMVSEMKSRLPTKISTPPERWGPWYFISSLPHRYHLMKLLLFVI